MDLPELERVVPLQGFRWLPISNAHVLAVAELETDGDHRDPFDRLLMCQSRVEPMLLLTGRSSPARNNSLARANEHVDSSAIPTPSSASAGRE